MYQAITPLLSIITLQICCKYTVNMLSFFFGSASLSLPCTELSSLSFAASYPSIFFPCVSSTNEAGHVIIGHDAYKPENRMNGLHHPVASCKEIDTVSIDYSHRL